MTDPRTLKLFVAQLSPGAKVTLRILRSEPGRAPAEKTLTATLNELPQEELLAGRTGSAPAERAHSGVDGLDGVEVTDLDARTRRQLHIPTSVRGALISNVDQGSNAAEAGLQQDDVILEIDRQPVRNAEDAVALSEKSKGDQVLLHVWRGTQGQGAMLYVPVDNKKHR
jgi:serine protease Do